MKPPQITIRKAACDGFERVSTEMSASPYQCFLPSGRNNFSDLERSDQPLKTKEGLVYCGCGNDCLGCGCGVGCDSAGCDELEALPPAADASCDCRYFGALMYP